MIQSVQSARSLPPRFRPDGSRKSPARRRSARERYRLGGKFVSQDTAAAVLRELGLPVAVVERVDADGFRAVLALGALAKKPLSFVTPEALAQMLPPARQRKNPRIRAAALEREARKREARRQQEIA